MANLGGSPEGIYLAPKPSVRYDRFRTQYIQENRLHVPLRSMSAERFVPFGCAPRANPESGGDRNEGSIYTGQEQPAEGRRQGARRTLCLQAHTRNAQPRRTNTAHRGGPYRLLRPS